MKLSEHFTLEEFRCKSGELPPTMATHPWVSGAMCWPLENLIELCREVLEPIRSQFGPVKIVSGYRSPAYNLKKIHDGHRVAPRSQHTVGRAADIQVAGVAPHKLFDWADDELSALMHRVGGLGLYARWLHVDTRPRRRGHVAKW